MPEVGVIIAAGGSGKRLGGRLPKQFMPLGGISILERTIRVFGRMAPVGEIVVVVPARHLARVRKIVRAARLRKTVRAVPGGKERQDSVWNGLTAFSSHPEIVVVHDAVRPFLTRRMIAEVVKGAKQYGAAVVGVPVRDTIKVERIPGFYTSTPKRSSLWAVQTPQGFRFDLILKAHRAARRSRFVGTDDASLVERLGARVRIIGGSGRNIKITTPDDLRIAKMMLQMPR